MGLIPLVILYFAIFDHSKISLVTNSSIMSAISGFFAPIYPFARCVWYMYRPLHAALLVYMWISSERSWRAIPKSRGRSDHVGGRCETGDGGEDKEMTVEQHSIGGEDDYAERLQTREKADQKKEKKKKRDRLVLLTAMAIQQTPQTLLRIWDAMACFSGVFFTDVAMGELSDVMGTCMVKNLSVLVEVVSLLCAVSVTTQKGPLKGFLPRIFFEDNKREERDEEDEKAASIKDGLVNMKA